MKYIITESQYKLIREHEISKQEYLHNYFSAPEETVVSEYNETETSTGFNIKQLKGINSFSGRVNYCKKYLQRIGAGSSRIVFIYDTDKVIKLAKNQKGIDQNIVEGDWSLQDYQLIPKLYDSDDYDLYNIMELLIPIKSPKRFTELTGVLWDDMIANHQGNNRDSDYNFYDAMNMKYVNNDIENEFIVDLFNLSQSYDLALGDLKRLSS